MVMTQATLDRLRLDYLVQCVLEAPGNILGIIAVINTGGQPITRCPWFEQQRCDPMTKRIVRLAQAESQRKYRMPDNHP